jgi:hypothetical protein
MIDDTDGYLRHAAKLMGMRELICQGMKEVGLNRQQTKPRGNYYRESKTEA